MATRVVYREPKDPQELYKDALENVSAFNSRLRYERRLRIPFIDAQTGIAMNNCHLWVSKLERRPGQTPHYIYSYPARRWRKTKRTVHSERPADEEVKNAEYEDQPTISVDAMDTEGGGFPDELEVEHPKETTVKEEAEPVGADSEGEEEVVEDVGALSTDDEEFVIGKKKKQGRPGRKKSHHITVYPEIQTHKSIPQGSGIIHVRNISKEELARMDPEERKKPYVCEICGRRYKNGPGLKYHYTHYNHDQEAATVHHEEPVVPHTLSEPSTSAAVESPKVPSPPQQQQQKRLGRPRKEPGHSVAPNNYCDFCLGDVYLNKKTGLPEELLSCADCGRSGHPTCLQFTGKLTESVKKYKWQCIECKSCTLCGTSDNDDQLLFCDDCDRGYHMYCLKPPMKNPPEGHWMCALCKNAVGPVTMPPQMMVPTEWH